MISKFAKRYEGCEDRLRKAGFPNIARMGEILSKPHDIDRALGYTNAASHWFAGRNNPSHHSETTAGLWLAQNDPDRNKQDDAPALDFDTVPEIPVQTELRKDETTILVAVPNNRVGKFKQVLAFFGFTDVIEADFDD